MVQRRESSLKHQTRCIRCSADNTGYAQSSIEGRVAVEYFDPSEEVQKLKYAFKCHRTPLQSGVTTIYPVNAIAFHPRYVFNHKIAFLTNIKSLGTFATGGCDGIVNIWDGKNKKRIYHMQKFPTSVASLSFNSDGSLLAVASSYTFELGEKEHPADEIYIRKVNDSDFKPKQVAKKM